MKIGDIIYIEFPNKCFSHNNGLKIITEIDIEQNTINICSIDNKGLPSLFDDGKYMVGTTSLSNPGITLTKMSYQLEPNFETN